MGQVASVESRPFDELGDFSPREIRDQVARISGSALFRRSNRLKDFLHYVCELTLKGEADRINEYLLAIEVFHRPSSYSSQEDSTVRRQAHLLREKLEKYYQTEGRNDSLRIDLPLGRYVPTFQRQMPREQPPPAHDAKRFSLAQVAVLLSLAAMAMFVIGRATGGLERGELPTQMSIGATTPLGEFWGPWLNDAEGAVLCFSSPLTAVIKHYPEPRTGTLVFPSLQVSGPEEELIRAAFGLSPGGFVYMTPNHSQVKKGEGFGAVLLAQLFAQAGTPFRVTESQQLSWNDFRSSNLILFGNGDTNSWLNPLLENYPLRLRTHQGDKPRSIVVAEPEPGEPAAYFTEYPNFWNKRRLDYALISMIPGLDHDVRLLLINGLNHYATQAAVEYLTRPADVESLLAHLRNASGQQEGPWFFQMVLKVEVREGVPTRSTPAALRLVSARDKDPLSTSLIGSQGHP